MDPPTPMPKTNYEKGERYLRLSLETLDELANLLDSESLSTSQKATIDEAHRSGKILYEETKKIRDKILTQKKSFRKLIVNFFIRESSTSTKHYYKVAQENYSSIKRTSDDLNRVLVSEIDTLLRNLGEFTQGTEAVNEESLRNVVEDNLAEGLSPSESTQGINPEAHTEQVQQTRVAVFAEEYNKDESNRSPYGVVEGNHSAEVLGPNEDTQDIHLNVHTAQAIQPVLNRLGIKFDNDDDRLGIKCDGDGDDGDDGDGDGDGETIRAPHHSPSRPPSPGRTCTINIFYNINQSVVSFDSELTSPTLNVGMNEGIGSTHR